MILSVHFLFGAAVGGALNNPVLALPAVFASHYMLDSLPHREYEIDNVTNIHTVGWHKTIKDFVKIAVDIVFGFILVIFAASDSAALPWLLIFGFIACVPDAISFLHFLAPNNILLKHQIRFHKLIHIHKNKNDTPWKIGILFQILTAFAAIVFLINL